MTDSLMGELSDHFLLPSEEYFHVHLSDRDGMTDGVDFKLSTEGTDNIPSNAIKLGGSSCGDVYLGAVNYFGVTTPCQIVPKTGLSSFLWGNGEKTFPICQYVVTKFGFSYEWVPSSDGNIPPEAVKLGANVSVTGKEHFVVGRVTIDEEICVGRILTSCKVCFAAKNRREFKMKYYDVLVVKPSPDIYGCYSGVSIYHSAGCDDIPENAIEAGLSPCGQIYVGFGEIGDRNLHYARGWETMPAKINPAYSLVYLAYKNAEYYTNKHMFLVINKGYKYEWVPDGDGYTPKNAVRLGRKCNGENFFVGRIIINGEKCVGKISTSQGCCDATYGGTTYCKSSYDVLVVTKCEDSDLINSTAHGLPLPNPLIASQTFPSSSIELEECGASSGGISYFPDREGLICGADFYLSKDINDIPENAIKLGISPCGEAYLGAVKYQGMTLPCKIVPKKRCCYFSYAGEELSLPFITVINYVVTEFGFSYKWLPSTEGNLPQYAVTFGGDFSTGIESLAVGRATIDEERCIGKIFRNRICFTSKNGKEHLVKYYDILLIQPYPDIYGCYSGVSIYHSTGPEDVPENAIEAENSPSGKIYVGCVEIGDRKFHYARGWETMPAKIKSTDRLAYYSYYGHEYSVNDLKFLVLEPGYIYEWVSGYSNGRVPPNCVRLGRRFNGENYYVGRIIVEGESSVGKISTSDSCCYAPFGGKEHKENSYDVLVVRSLNEPISAEQLPPPPTPPPSLPAVLTPTFDVIPEFHDIIAPYNFEHGSSEEDMDDEGDIFGLESHGTDVPENWTRKPFVINETHRLTRSFVDRQFEGLEVCLQITEEEKLAENEEDRLCVICKINIPTRVIVPCGHDGLCRRCIEILIREPRMESPSFGRSIKKPVLCPVCQSLVHTFCITYKV